MWSYFNDFFQQELIYSPMPEHAGFIDSMRMLRDYELEKEITRFELWATEFDEEYPEDE